MKVPRRIIIIGLLAAALVGGGYWAREKMIFAEIGSIFAVGPLSPVLDHHQSADRYDIDKVAQIEREMHELKDQLDVEANCWRATMIALFSGGGIMLLGCIWLSWRHWRPSQVTVS